MPSAHDQPKKILVLAANPCGQAQLRLAEEVREIASGLRSAKERDRYQIEYRLAARPRDLQQAMLEVKPQIVHFCGHGSGARGIVFENSNGEAQMVSSSALANLFDIFSSYVECVVLNACYSEHQAEAISRHIRCVVGMRNVIGDAAAIKFSTGFYESLGAGNSYEFSYRIGCNAIELEGLPDHLTPAIKVTNQKVRQVLSKINDSSLETTRDFEDDVHEQFVTLERQGLVKILGRSLRLPDRDGIEREVHLLVELYGPLHSVQICVECKRSRVVTIEAIDRIRSLRLTLPHNVFMIIASGKVSGPVKRAAEKDKVPIVTYKDLERLVAKTTERVSERECLRPIEAWKFLTEPSNDEAVPYILKELVPNWIGASWPCLVTSKTQMGLLLFRWISEANGIDWKKLASLAMDEESLNKILA